MKVNTDKTKYIIFHKKGRQLNLQGLSILYNDNEPFCNDPELISNIDRVYSEHPSPECRVYKSLGIYLDENLTLNYHFTCLHKKLTKAIYILSKLKHFLPPHILKTLYYSTVT